MKAFAWLLGASLLLAGLACDRAGSDSGDLARPGTGGAGGAGGAVPDTMGGTGGGGSAGTAGTGGPEAGGAGSGGSAGAEGPTDGPSGVDSGSDGAPMAIAPPNYPPRGTGGCAPGCAELRRQYADAVLEAQGCSGDGACAFKAPGSLGCGGCPVWVTDLGKVAPIANRFNQMGCYGCYFDGPGGENRCHTIGCPDLLEAMCTMSASGRGTCTNNMNITCPDGAMNGAPCDQNGFYCTRGNTLCLCHFTSPNWMCSGS